MPTTHTFAPDSTVSNTNCAVTGASAHAALSDASTATYVTIGTGPSPGQLDLGCSNPSAFAAGSMVYGIRAVVQYFTSSGQSPHLDCKFLEAGATPVGGGLTTTPRAASPASSFATQYQLTKSNGAQWTNSDVDALGFRLLDDSSGTGQPSVTLLQLEALVYAKPTVAITSLSGYTLTSPTAKPSVNWTFTGDGLDQAAFEVKVFTDADASAGGFDPTTSDKALFSVFKASSSSLYNYFTTGGYTPPDGVLLRYYVRAAQQVGTSLHWSDWQYGTITIDRPPLAPTLVYPAPSQTLDTGAGFTMKVRQEHNGGGATMAKFAVRRKVGAGAYSYWRDSDDSWQATVQWNPWTAEEYAFPAGAWPNGSTYLWSAATEDNDGDQGPFAADQAVVANAKPVVSMVYPTGFALITDTTQPTCTFSYSDAEGDPMEQWQAEVHDLIANPTAQAGITTPLWGSGMVAGTNDAFTPGVQLESGKSYLICVRAYSNGQWSDWSAALVTVVLDAPATPVVIALNEDDEGRVKLIAFGFDNMLTKTESDFEDATTAGWTAANAALDTVTTPTPLHGTRVMRATGSNTTAVTVTTTKKTAVAGGVYTAGAFVRANTTTRGWKAQLLWYNASDVLIATSDGSVESDATGAWTDVVVSATAPAGAAKVALRLASNGNANGEIHYVEVPFLRPGVGQSWTRGGFGSVFDFESSDDGGETWQPLRGASGVAPDTYQTAAVYDYEITPRTERQYRVRARGVL
jgi:hypothetical protein